jgi:hypothetical protein
MASGKSVAASLAAAAVFAGGGVMLGSGNAAAASYNGACGAGYSVIDHHDLDGGTIFLTYNGGWNCVVTVRNQPGAAIHMMAQIERNTDTSTLQIDQGNYTAYAGPVFVYAPQTCVTWGGQIQPPPPYQGGNAWTQVGGHCG